MEVRVEDVSYSYPGSTDRALADVSLTIRPGERIALVGQNGSGKSTLARHLNGLLRPERGRVLVGDWTTSEHGPAEMARRVAYAFQNPDEQLFHQRVRGEVAFGPRNLGVPPQEVRVRVEEALAMFGLDAEVEANPRDLGSSGRRRVTLASSVAMRTPVLVLDEPTAGLDAGEQAQLSRAIDALHRQGTTVLIIAHDMDFLAENSDRLVLLDAGRIVLDADVRTFFSQGDVLRTCGLVAPQMVRLREALGVSDLADALDGIASEVRAARATGRPASVAVSSPRPEAAPG